MTVRESRLMLTFDPERQVSQHVCTRCGSEYRRIVRFLLRDGSAQAVCFAALHEHDGNREAWLDVILGTWAEAETDDHVTFGCRVGPVAGQTEPAASLVTAAAPYSDSPMFGK